MDWQRNVRPWSGLGRTLRQVEDTGLRLLGFSSRGKERIYAVYSKQTRAAVSRGRAATYRRRRCISWKILEGSTTFCLLFCSYLSSLCCSCSKSRNSLAIQAQNQAMQAQNKETPMKESLGLKFKCLEDEISSVKE
ncbi:hypothetical protein LAZ67_8001147 [Cordylochernes scorpioides]|uniref:Uncharacterized protein n=1 Tax=Cordylochernes scorpioides TaxID=51811 RepID=A0ABY6KPZ1_9ARAC|nr:hypothetical protein LAZ67_8001147 [Cordylochernes scorpioides]